MKNFFSKILSGFYYLITAVRNFLYDNKVLKSHEFSSPVISVGNITVGGTGKTPHTEYIVNLLKDKFNVTILSRGYKRKTKGYIQANKNSTVAEIGDEPKQMTQKFLGKAFVAVCEDRIKGINKILNKNIDNQLIVLDDAFQHRSVVPLVNILLTDYNRPLYEDHLLPYGQLRESSKNISRAHIIIVTKCPEDLKPIERNIIAKNLNKLPSQAIYFTNFQYTDLKSVFDQNTETPQITENTEILLITGIASPEPLKDYIKKTFSQKITHIKFKDHHNFRKKDIQKITESFKSLSADKIIITTEKDAVRLNELNFEQEIRKKMFFLPVKVNFLSLKETDDQEKFNNQLLKYVTEDTTNYRLHTTVR